MKMSFKQNSWVGRLLLLTISVVAILAIWLPTVNHMVGILYSVDVFAHGLLAPFVSITLIWAKKEQLRTLSPGISLLGLVVVAAASVLWLGGELLGVALFQHIALVTSLQGIVLGLLGWRIYRLILFPMLFLFFAVPFGYELVGPLQRTTASMVITVLDLVGANFSAEGMLITLPSGLYEVAKACAGVKFLFTSIFTGTLLSYLLYETWQRKWLIVGISIILPIFANVARVLLILLIAELSDQALAKGFDHLVYGWVFLSFVLFLLISIAYRFADKDFSLGGGGINSSNEEPSAVSSALIIAVTIVGLGLPAATVTIAPPAEGRELALKQAIPVEELIEEAIPGYRVLPDTGLVVRPSFLIADKQKASLLRKGGSVFNVYVATVDELVSGQRLFQPGNSLVGPDWRNVSTRKLGEKCSANNGFTETIFKRGNDRTIVWSLFEIDGQPVANSVEEKLQTALLRLQRKPLSGRVLVLSAPLQDNAENIRRIFLEFLSTFDAQQYLTDDGGVEQRGDRLCAE